MPDQRRIDLSEKYRGVEMTSETTIVLDALQKVEERLETKLDEIKVTLKETQSQTQANKERLIEHCGRIASLEQNRLDNKEQHQQYYDRIGILETARSAEDGKDRSKNTLIPNIIAVIGIASSVIMAIFLYLLTKGK